MVKIVAEHPKGIGQWLSLSLTSSNENEKKMVNAKLVIHGVRPNAHVTQALSGANGPDNIVRTFTVPLSTAPKKSLPANSFVHQEARANLWVPGVSVVDRIDLVSLEYSDGTTWNLTAGQSCYAVPDPVMLLTSR